MRIADLCRQELKVARDELEVDKRQLNLTENEDTRSQVARRNWWVVLYITPFHQSLWLHARVRGTVFMSCRRAAVGSFCRRLWSTRRICYRVRSRGRPLTCQPHDTSFRRGTCKSHSFTARWLLFWILVIDDWKLLCDATLICNDFGIQHGGILLFVDFIRANASKLEWPLSDYLTNQQRLVSQLTETVMHANQSPRFRNSRTGVQSTMTCAQCDHC